MWGLKACLRIYASGLTHQFLIRKNDQKIVSTASMYVGGEQGDQIGRIFAYGVTVYYG
jgi:hypothetical protein